MLKLLSESDNLLRQVSEPWDFAVDGNPTQLVKEMCELMVISNGIGLAAPQVGIFKRLFVMGNRDKFFACINPEIMSTEGEEKELEGCLSFPNLWLKVKRPTTITVKYQVVTGHTVEEHLSGLIARVFQHERDHLDGICFDTKVGPVTLQLARQRQKKKLR